MFETWIAPPLGGAMLAYVTAWFIPADAPWWERWLVLILLIGGVKLTSL